MALKSGRVGVNPDQVDLHGRIKNITPPDLSAYVKKTEAVGYDDILTQTEASSDYQEKLVSGTNIKTINGNSLLGSGDLEIGGGGGGDLSAYVKKVDAPGYDDILTETEASSIYQTQSGMSAYQTVSGMSAYQTVSGMSNYVAKSEAIGYDDILTQTDAESTYMQIADMTDYVQKSQAVGYNDILTNTNANATYVKKADATGYNDILTQTNASAIYQTKLISGTSIKTINNESVLGSGNITALTSYGVDTANIIASGNNYNNNDTITAVLGSQPLTESAILTLSYNQPSQYNLYIDGVKMDLYSASSTIIVPIAKGSVITHAKTNNHSYWYLYGVK